MSKWAFLVWVLILILFPAISGAQESEPAVVDQESQPAVVARAAEQSPQVNMWVAAILPAIVGALAALLVVYLTERTKSESEYRKEVRLALAGVAGHLGASAHSAAWLTWKARYRPQLVEMQDVQDYDKEMHRIFPNLTSTLVLLAALDKTLYDKMRPMVLEVYALDAKIGRAAAKMIQRNDDGIKGLDGLYDIANKLEESLPESAANIMVSLKSPRS